MNVKLISCCRREFFLTLSSTKFVPLDQLNQLSLVLVLNQYQNSFSCKKGYTIDSVFCLTRIETVGKRPLVDLKAATIFGCAGNIPFVAYLLFPLSDCPI